MTTHDDDPDRGNEDQKAAVPQGTDATRTRLGQAGAGIVEAQAWKGQQLANGWNKLMSALRRRKQSGS